MTLTVFWQRRLGELVQDHLTEMRNTWVNLLACRVCHKLAPDTEYADLLAPWVADDPLTLAAVVSRIAAEDIKGSSPYTISQGLLSTGIVTSGVPAPVVARMLVMPVLRKFRKNGAPWERWWDIRGLSELLVELWAGRRLVTHPREAVRHEVVALWRAPSALLDILLDNSAEPFTCLPPDFFRESPTGAAKNITRGLIGMGVFKAGFGDEFLQDRPELIERPDLAEVARRWYRRGELEYMVRCRMGEISPELAADLRNDLEAWDAEMRQLTYRLTAYELALLSPMAGDERYSEKCLQGGRGIHNARLLTDDALLWEPGDCASDEPVPGWMVEEIVTCGTRSFHMQAGPHPVWMATAEVDAHLAAVKALMEPGTRYGFDVEDSGDTVKLWLVLPLPPDDLGPPSQVPYTYDLSWVAHAWELLHLAAVGYTRLCVVRLVGDGELRPVGTIWIQMPEEVRTRIQKYAVAALHRLIGDETETIKQRIATEGNDQAAAVAFRICENAKAEDICDELELLSDPAVSVGIVSAARHLARVRALRAACVLDRGDTSECDKQVKLAIEERQRQLELVRGAPDEENEQKRSRRRGVSLLDEQTMFVHLVNRYGRLQLAACWSRKGHPYFELLPHKELLLAPVAEAVRAWTRHSQNGPGGAWHHLRDLLAVCAELAQSITARAEKHGLRRLILSPTAPLELLPLHAALLNTTHPATLNDTFDYVGYAPTARLLSAIQRSERYTAADEVLVVAHSGAGIAGFELSGPFAEANLITTLHGSAKVLVKEEATPDRVLREMSSARIIHVASHGLTHADRWAAGLALHGDSLGQATLTTSRILADGTFSSADLVILNACRTGTHESTALSVQTLRSLESAFLARGARAVISTLWEITDLQGVVFSAVLHAHLSVGADPGSAFGDTIRYLRQHEWSATAQHEQLVSAESLIDAVYPAWRNELDRQAAENPLLWAAFKITGVV